MTNEENGLPDKLNLSVIELFGHSVLGKLIEISRTIGPFHLEKDDPQEVIKFFKEWIVDVRSSVWKIETTPLYLHDLQSARRMLNLFEMVLEGLESRQGNIFTHHLSTRPACRPKDPAAYGRLKDEVAKGYKLLQAKGASQEEAVAALNAVLASGKLPIMTVDAIRKRATNFKLQDLEIVGGFFLAPDIDRVSFMPEHDIQDDESGDWFPAENSAESRKSLFEAYALICLHEYLEKARFAIAK